VPPLPAPPPVAELSVMVLPVTVRVAGVPAFAGAAEGPSLKMPPPKPLPPLAPEPPAPPTA
jgi:hypothetical protein